VLTFLPQCFDHALQLAGASGNHGIGKYTRDSDLRAGLPTSSLWKMKDGRFRPIVLKNSP
jgi:hypothetical protein